MKNYLFTYLLLFVSIVGFSQVDSIGILHFEVNRVLPYISVDVAQLEGAKTLIDLDRNYKASWVKSYISVEISAYVKGEIVKASGLNDSLIAEQKLIMSKADYGTDIKVEVQYIPENNLSKNDIHLNDFTFIINPKKPAKYVGGEQKMIQYLKENAIDKIPEGTFTGYDITAIMFTINEEGEITEASLFDTAGYGVAKNEKIDNLLLETIQKMPCWKPAEYANGEKTKQKYVFTVGNHESCLIPLFSIREY